MAAIEKGCIAVIFVSRRTSQDGDGYVAAAAEMEEAVARAPGYLGHDSAASPDGAGITVSYWRDEASAASWRNHARHSEVRSEGRARWYEYYRLVVADVSRVHDWRR